MGEMRSVQQSEKLCFIESKVFNVSASEGLLSCCVSNASEGSPGKLGDKTLRERCLWGYNGGNIKLRKLFTFKRKSNNYFPSSFFLAHKTNFLLKVDEIHTKTLHPYGASKHKSKPHHERNDFNEHHNENGKSSRGKLEQPNILLDHFVA